MSVKIPKGCVFVARKLLRSDIWLKKPSWWLKVWLYILMEVNHKDNELFKRGENFFNYRKIFEDCNLFCEGNDTKSLDNLMRWLKSTKQITTRRTTRGFIISVCNYGFYQELRNYRNDTDNDTENDSETKQKRQRNDTINKNVKNDNKETITKDIVPPSDTNKVFDYFCLKYKEVFNKEYVANFGKDKKLIKDLLNVVKIDELISLIDRFFESDEEFIQKAGYTLGVFKSQINKLRSKKTSLITFRKD